MWTMILEDTKQWASAVSTMIDTAWDSVRKFNDSFYSDDMDKAMTKETKEFQKLIRAAVTMDNSKQIPKEEPAPMKTICNEDQRESCERVENGDQQTKSIEQNPTHILEAPEDPPCPNLAPQVITYYSNEACKDEDVLDGKNPSDANKELKNQPERRTRRRSSRSKHHFRKSSL